MDKRIISGHKRFPTQSDSYTTSCENSSINLPIWNRFHKAILMIDRSVQSLLQKRLENSPAVALLGSRQVGKTTLAKSLKIEKPTHYLDLERPSDIAKLADAELDLVLETPEGTLTAIEIKRTLSPKISRGYTESFNTLQASQGYYIIPQAERFPLTKDTHAMNLPDFLAQLNAAKG